MEAKEVLGKPELEGDFFFFSLNDKYRISFKIGNKNVRNDCSYATSWYCFLFM